MNASSVSNAGSDAAAGRLERLPVRLEESRRAGTGVETAFPTSLQPQGPTIHGSPDLVIAKAASTG